MDLAVINGQKLDTLGAGSSSVYGTAFQSAAFTHNDGAWASLGTIGPAASGFWLTFRTICTTGISFSTPCSMLADIGYDAAGGTSYTVIVNNIYAAVPSDDASIMFCSYWPISLASGASIAIRARFSRINVEGYATLYPVSMGWANPLRFQQCVTYGDVAGSSTGTQIDPGGTADTKGSWVQMTSSTAVPIRFLNLLVSMENSGSSNAEWKVDVGIGGAGSETVIEGDLLARCKATYDMIVPNAYGFWHDVPASTRLAVRAQCSITDATDRLFNAVLYGVG